MTTRTAPATRITIASLARELAREFDRSTLHGLWESAREAADTDMARIADRAEEGSARATRAIARMALRGDLDLRLAHGIRVATRPGVCAAADADEGTAHAICDGVVRVAWDQGVTTYCPAADLVII